ncbi:hypothetical protein SAMN04488090_1652 [Siphonobacter aquaeclarae]|jgi:hypothetical protein|uniref:Uncharacterized protein n=1 Tax=Siphonobacter aquaeclarae TaxID=563176 RepID=A0A1G9ML91_9BACT|nr:hypothetical protein SAMN04488090_1652 [Siphonobacter aquaeclarae]
MGEILLIFVRKSTGKSELMASEPIFSRLSSRFQYYNEGIGKLFFCLAPEHFTIPLTTQKRCFTVFFCSFS